MAKLDVVIPAVEVEVNGVKYRKVDREAKAGDIVRAKRNELDIDAGAYYKVFNVDGEIGFYDDGDDFRISPLKDESEDYEVYEKVTEPVTTKYREVKRKAQVGERIKIVDSCDTRYDSGDEFTVASISFMDEGVYVKHPEGTYNGCIGVSHYEYVVLEPVEQPEPPKPARLKVGDYAKVTSDVDKSGSKRSEVKIGEVRKIIEDDGSAVPFKAEQLDGKDFEWFREDALVRATEAEVEAAKKEAAKKESAQIAEEAKWAKIGRKVNEFKAGDVVQITANTNGSVNKVGSYGEVTGGPSISGSYRVDTGAGSVSNLTRPDDMRLIVPVEQRFDMQKEDA